MWTPPERQGLGYLLIIVATLCWATLGVLGRLAFRLGTGPQDLVTLRALVGTLLIFIILLVGKRRVPSLARHSLPLFIGLGLSVAVNYSTFFYGVERIGASVATAIFYIYPVVVSLLARVFLAEPLSSRKGVALLLAVMGCSLVSGLWETSLSFSGAGIAFVILSAIALSVYTLLVRVAVRRHPPGQVLAGSLLFAAPFLILASLLTSGGSFVNQPLKVWGIILLLAIVPTLGGYYLFALALRWVEASRATIVATLEPVLASLLAFITLGERLSTLQSLGIVGIVIAAILAREARKRRT